MDVVIVVAVAILIVIALVVGISKWFNSTWKPYESPVEHRHENFEPVEWIRSNPVGSRTPYEVPIPDTDRSTVEVNDPLANPDRKEQQELEDISQELDEGKINVPSHYSTTSTGF